MATTTSGKVLLISLNPPEFVKQPVLKTFGEDNVLLRSSEDATKIPEDERKQIEGILIAGHTTTNGAFMDMFPNLKVISNHGVGVDHIDLNAAKERNIKVGALVAEVLSNATADMAMTLLLATARHLTAAARYSRREEGNEDVVWTADLYNGFDISEATVGILGLGHIGKKIAKRAQGFDMKVLYHNRTQLPKDEEEAIGATYASLDDLLKGSDYLVIVAPLTEQTKGMIGMEQLKLMKPTSVLINIARGGIVKTNDLVQALNQGIIGAAGLDVTDPEPLPKGHPLLAMSNVIVTPHIGSSSIQTRRNMIQMAVDNLVSGLSNAKMIRQLV